MLQSLSFFNFANALDFNAEAKTFGISSMIKTALAGGEDCYFCFPAVEECHYELNEHQCSGEGTYFRCDPLCMASYCDVGSQTLCGS